jgi:hypothetical protein
MHSLCNPLFSSEMPDTKAEDEVDFLNKISSSSGSEELAVENGAGVPQMKQGPKTQVVSASGSLYEAQVCSHWSPCPIYGLGFCYGVGGVTVVLYPLPLFCYRNMGCCCS